ncbi:PHP domain protein [Ferroglobus placidus DSM 10642]|uniref:PHP domain protein n=1 Tax=Ferroglobus placidus (strain DSM 10642 / AEDII12DO) TaxID=589924 RepID=D3S0X8_FERPA|nr:PHP domain-containing protein [Ferroglobus placidus]ADC66369.1 PHP domain protein [Ferroglobus placidus DSM 10642]
MIAELHVHSNHSDGRDSVKKLLDRALEIGIEVISITDHDTVNGSLEAIEIVEEEHLPLKVIPGFEASTTEGHLLVYGVRNDFDKGIPFEEAVEKVRKHGGVCYVAHPFQIERKGAWRIGALRKADGIEGFNSKYIIGFFNFLSLTIAKKLNKPVIAGSDAHSAKALGYGITILRGEPLKALKNGDVSISGKRMPLKVWLSDSLGLF